MLLAALHTWEGKLAREREGARRVADAQNTLWKRVATNSGVEQWHPCAASSSLPQTRRIAEWKWGWTSFRWLHNAALILRIPSHSPIVSHPARLLLHPAQEMSATTVHTTPGAEADQPLATRTGEQAEAANATTPAAAAPASASSASASPAPSLHSLPPSCVQRVCSFLSLRDLAAGMLCTQHRIRDAMHAESSSGSTAAPIPFPALAALPSHVWPALAQSRHLRKHVCALTVPASPLAAAAAAAAGSSSSPAAAAACDPTDRATLQRHFPCLASVTVATKAPHVADLNFASNMRVLERMETMDEGSKTRGTGEAVVAASDEPPFSAAALASADDNALPAAAPAHASSSSISLSNAAAAVALPPSTGSSPTHTPTRSIATIEAMPQIPTATAIAAESAGTAVAAAPVAASAAPIAAAPAAASISTVATPTSAVPAAAAPVICAVATTDSTPSNSVLFREVPSAPVSDREEEDDEHEEEEEEPSMIMNHSREDLDVESDTPVTGGRPRWKGSISIDPDAGDDDEEEGSVRQHDVDPDSIVSSTLHHSRSNSPSSTIRRPPNKAAKLLGLGAFESTVSGVSPMNGTGAAPRGNGGQAATGTLKQKALSPRGQGVGGGQTAAANGLSRPRVSFAGMESVSVSENSLTGGGGGGGSRGVSGDYSGLASLVSTTTSAAPAAAAGGGGKKLGTPKASSSISSNFGSTIVNPSSAGAPPPSYSQSQVQSKQSSVSALGLPSSVPLPALARRISQSRQELLASFAATGGPLTLVLLGARNLRLVSGSKSHPDPVSSSAGGKSAPAASTKGLPDPYVSLTAVWNHKKFKSSVQKTTVHPIFNQKFTLNVPPAPVTVGPGLSAPASAAASTTNSPAMPAQTKLSGATSETMTAPSAAVVPSVPAASSSAVTSSASSWSRGVRFRVYHKSALFGKSFLGEVLLDLNALLGLAALQRDVWIPLRDRREDRSSTTSSHASTTVSADVAKQHNRGSTSTTAGSLSLDDENRKSLSIATTAPTLSSAGLSTVASKDSGGSNTPGSPLGGAGIDASLSSAAAEALAPPSAASGDRGELHLIVTVDPLSFQAMLKGLASRSRRAGGSAEISATPPASTRSLMFSTSSASNVHGTSSLAPMRSTTDQDDAASADGGNPLHSPPAAMLRRRSRSDAGTTTMVQQPTSGGSEDDSVLSPGVGTKGAAATMPAPSSGTAAPAASTKRAQSPHALILTPSRRAISMDFSPQALHNRRTILTPVLAGDTPDHSVSSTPSRDGGATTAVGKSPGLNSSDSSIVGGGPHNSFSTPDKSSTAAGGANSIESPALSAIRAMYAGSGSKLSSPRGGGSGGTGSAEQPDRSPSSLPGVGGFKASLLARRHSSSPAGSASDLTSGATAGAEGKTVSASPHHSAAASPALQLPAAALASKDLGSSTTGVNGSPKPDRDDGHASAEAEAAETLDLHETDDLDDTILWSPAEQRKRESAYRKQIGSLKVALQRAQEDGIKAQQKMREKMALDHAAQLIEEKSKTASAVATATAAVQAAAAAQKAASASPSSEAVSAATTRLETSLRESERKLAAQGVELKAVQAALASARLTHARELDLLRSKLMQSAAESAAFAAYKKSSVLYVQSLRGSNDTQLLQLQSMGERLESVETALRAEKDRFVATKSKHKQRVIMLSEQLEQTTASLHVLQLKYDKLVDAHRMLQSDLDASESQASELSSKLDAQTQRYKSLVEEMRAFNSRAGVNVSLQLLAVLREVALAKEDLASVTTQASLESKRLAETIRARQEIEELRADHARLASENVALRTQQQQAEQEHKVLLELLQAEVASRTDTAAATSTNTTGGLASTATNGAAFTVKDSQQPPVVASMNGHSSSSSSSSNGHASLSLPLSPWVAAPPLSLSAAPVSSPASIPFGSAVHSIEGVRSHFPSPQPQPQQLAVSSAAAGSNSSAWAQQALSLSAARQQQQSQQARSLNGLPLPSPFLALPFTFASSPPSSS